LKLQCQKANWSKHKASCHDVERGISKLLKAFLANEILREYLEVCLCLEFDLVNKPAPDTPFLARVDVGIEPSDISVFLSLYSGSYGIAEPEKIQGMLQIDAVTPIQPRITPLPTGHLATWRKVRETLCADGEASTPVVIVALLSRTNPRSSFETPLPISSVAMEMARAKRPFENHSFVTGKSDIPMTTSSCLNYINNAIRMDTQNQLLLRMEMRNEDRDVIRAAGRGEDTTAVRLLKEKMERARIYVSLSGSTNDVVCLSQLL